MGWVGQPQVPVKQLFWLKVRNLITMFDYLFGQVSIDKAFVDWSGNCGNLTAAVGSFAISNGLVATDRIPENGILYGSDLASQYS